MNWFWRLLCVLGLHSWGDPEYICGRISGTVHYGHQHCTRPGCNVRRRTA